MKKRTGKMISLSLAVAMAVTAAPVTALADENTQSNVIEASELTTAQNAGETETDTTTIDTKEEPATVVATPVVDEAEMALMGTPAPVSNEVTVDSKDALEAAVADSANVGKTIVITEDINIPEGFTISQNITLEGRKADGSKAKLIGSMTNTNHGIIIDDSVTNVTLRNLHITEFGGSKTGNMAVTIGNRTNLFTGTANIENCTVDKFGKGGIVAFGGTINVTDCKIDVTNVNSVANRTPNGIQLTRVENATIRDNTITDSNSTSAKWEATGILLTEGANAAIDGNTLDNCNQGIAISDYYDSYFKYFDTKKPEIKNIESVVSRNTFTNFDDAKNRVTSTVPPNNAVFVNSEGEYSFVDADEVYYTAGANSDNTELKCFTSLEKAIQNAPERKTIVLTEDISLTNTITVNKNVSISGKDPHGSIHTIIGDNEKVYSAFVINSGKFSIEDVNVTQFGGNHEVGSKAVFSVPKTAANTNFEAKNVNVSDFNRTAFDIRSGSFGIRECVIDCKNTYSQTPNAEKVLTKGILAGLGTNKVEGLIEDIEIKGAESKYDEWDSAGIEIYSNADVIIRGGNIEASTTGIWVDNYYKASETTDNKTVVAIEGVTVDAKDAVKVYYQDDNGTHGNGTVDVTIESGNFTGTISIVGDEDSTTNNIDISGGKFTNPGNQINDFLEDGLKLDGNGNVVDKSSGGSSHRYDNYITVITPKNGEVSVSDDWAYVGDKVTLTVTPDKGYVVDKIEIVDAEGNKLEAKKVDDKDNEYTFKVKNSDVTVTVTFKEEGKTTEDTDKEEGKDEETTETTELNFTDVKESDWFFKGVEYVVDKGIMSGVSENEFAPSGKLTRAMLVQMLYNMESRPACDAENAFMDVPVGQWYTDAVIWANDAKIVSGMGEGLFAPNMEITREQMVAMLYNYAKYKGYDVTASADLSAFADTASVSAWAQPAMQWAVAEGYISGMGDSQLAPQGTATRAEIASVIMRFMEATAETAE